MKLNTQLKLKNLDGETLEIKDGDTKKQATVSDYLPNILLSDEKGGKMKLYELATKIHKNKTVELDTSDLTLVKNAVKNTKLPFTAIITGQLEKILENLKD